MKQDRRKVPEKNPYPEPDMQTAMFDAHEFNRTVVKNYCAETNQDFTEVEKKLNENGHTVAPDKPLTPTGKVTYQDLGGAVVHPNHYNKSGIECWDAIGAATVDLVGIESFLTGNVIKYMWRWKFKGGVEDLSKAKFYLDTLIRRANE